MNDRETVREVKRQIKVRLKAADFEVSMSEYDTDHDEEGSAYFFAQRAFDELEKSRDAAGPCKTVADLLSCDDTIVWETTNAAIGITAPTPHCDRSGRPQENQMTKDPVVKRVLDALERAVHEADDAFEVAADDDAADAAAFADARDAADAASDDHEAAQECSTIEGLLACDRPAVRAAAQFELEPTEPVAKRVIGVMQRAHDDACRADDAAYAAEGAKLAAGIELVPGDEVREALMVAVENTQTDLYAALKCKTIVALLSSDRQAVRLAAQFALAPTPTATAPSPGTAKPPSRASTHHR